MSKKSDTDLMLVSEYANTITIKQKGGKPLILPLSAEDNRKMSQLQVAKGRAALDEWLRENKDNMGQLTPKHLKDLFEAITSIENLGKQAYSDNEEDKEKLEDSRSIARAAVDAALYIKDRQDKVNRAKPVEDPVEGEIEDV